MAGVGGEANLVVAHDVDGAVRGVLRQVGEMEGLVHDPLPRERCVAVQQHWQNLYYVIFFSFKKRDIVKQMFNREHLHCLLNEKKCMNKKSQLYNYFLF